MEREKGASGPSQRSWSIFLAACWGLLGTWVLASGETWLGLGQLALAAAFLTAALSPRFARWSDAPLFRRK